MTDIILSLAPAITLALAAGMVGVFALIRRMSLAADAMSHIALPGLGIALLFKINPMIGGAATLLAGSVVIWALERKSRIPAEAIIGVIFSLSLALGTLITPQKDLIEALFGGFGRLDPWLVVVTTGAALGIIAAMLTMRYELMLTMVSRDLARVTGLKSDRLDLIFLVLFAVTIILGLRFLGALLMGSLIIIPAAAAKHVSWNIASMLVFSALFALVAVAGGVLAASYYTVSTGPVIVSLAGVLFFLSFFMKR